MQPPPPAPPPFTYNRSPFPLISPFRENPEIDLLVHNMQADEWSGFQFPVMSTEAQISQTRSVAMLKFALVIGVGRMLINEDSDHCSITETGDLIAADHGEHVTLSDGNTRRGKWRQLVGLGQSIYFHMPHLLPGNSLPFRFAQLQPPPPPVLSKRER